MKAAPEGVSVLKIEAESAPMMTYYRANFAEYVRIANALKVPTFSSYCVAELERLLPKSDAIEIIQSVVRLKNYTDENEHVAKKKIVTRLLKIRGVRLPRGKRPGMGMLNLVNDIAPILLYFGLPCASSERSRLVVVLRIIATEIGLDGDPRDAIRREIKIKRTGARKALKELGDAWATALNPFTGDYPD